MSPKGLSSVCWIKILTSRSGKSGEIEKIINSALWRRIQDSRVYPIRQERTPYAFDESVRDSRSAHILCLLNYYKKMYLLCPSIATLNNYSVPTSLYEERKLV